MGEEARAAAGMGAAARVEVGMAAATAVGMAVAWDVAAAAMVVAVTVAAVTVEVGRVEARVEARVEGEIEKRCAPRQGSRCDYRPEAQLSRKGLVGPHKRMHMDHIEKELFDHVCRMPSPSTTLLLLRTSSRTWRTSRSKRLTTIFGSCVCSWMCRLMSSGVHGSSSTVDKVSDACSAISSRSRAEMFCRMYWFTSFTHAFEPPL